VDFDEFGVQETPIYAREMLPVGEALHGPAVIEEPATTIIVLPGQSAHMDSYGNVHIIINPEGRGAHDETH
jgi:N-methylhydantoinase A